MGEFPNKATQFKAGDKQVIIATKAGQSTSIKKKNGAQLRALRKRGDTNAEVAFFVKRLEDPDANILHIQQMLDKFLKDHPKEHNAITAMQTLIQLHKAHFGEKRINKNININIDIDLEVDELDKHIIDVMGE